MGSEDGEHAGGLVLEPGSEDVAQAQEDLQAEVVMLRRTAPRKFVPKEDSKLSAIAAARQMLRRVDSPACEAVEEGAGPQQAGATVATTPGDAAVAASPALSPLPPSALREEEERAVPGAGAMAAAAQPEGRRPWQAPMRLQREGAPLVGLDIPLEDMVGMMEDADVAVIRLDSALAFMEGENSPTSLLALQEALEKSQQHAEVLLMKLEQFRRRTSPDSSAPRTQLGVETIKEELRRAVAQMEGLPADASEDAAERVVLPAALRVDFEVPSLQPADYRAICALLIRLQAALAAWLAKVARDVSAWRARLLLAIRRILACLLFSLLVFYLLVVVKAALARVTATLSALSAAWVAIPLSCIPPFAASLLECLDRVPKQAATPVPPLSPRLSARLPPAPMPALDLDGVEGEGDADDFGSALVLREQLSDVQHCISSFEAAVHNKMPPARLHTLWQRAYNEEGVLWKVLEQVLEESGSRLARACPVAPRRVLALPAPPAQADMVVGMQDLRGVVASLSAWWVACFDQDGVMIEHLGAMAANVNALEQHIQSYSSEISTLEKRMRVFQRSLSDLSSRREQATSLNQLRRDVTCLKTQLDLARINQADAQVATLRKQVGRLQRAVDAAAATRAPHTRTFHAHWAVATTRTSLLGDAEYALSMAIQLLLELPFPADQPLATLSGWREAHMRGVTATATPVLRVRVWWDGVPSQPAPATLEKAAPAPAPLPAPSADPAPMVPATVLTQLPPRPAVPTSRPPAPLVSPKLAELALERSQRNMRAVLRSRNVRREGPPSTASFKKLTYSKDDLARFTSYLASALSRGVEPVIQNEFEEFDIWNAMGFDPSFFSTLCAKVEKFSRGKSSLEVASDAQWRKDLPHTVTSHQRWLVTLRPKKVGDEESVLYVLVAPGRMAVFR